MTKTRVHEKPKFTYTPGRGFFWRLACRVVFDMARDVYVGPYPTLDEAWAAARR